jgi:DNA-binding CsgD family transcriptional regulator
MRSTKAEAAEWLELAATLARGPADSFPMTALTDQLFATYGCVVSWNFMNADGSFGFEMRDRIPGFPPEGEDEVWQERGMASHPIFRWYATTRQPWPMTIDRVPAALSPPEFATLRELLAPFGLEHQLTMPYRYWDGAMHLFVLARADDDFSDQELQVAGWIQPLVMMLERQASVCDRAGPPVAGELTCRELAVLQLLREGHTAVSIGHQLAISPRTVHTHLSSLYRKLGVTDRLGAVLAAQELGLVAVRGDAGSVPVNGARARGSASRGRLHSGVREAAVVSHLAPSPHCHGGSGPGDEPSVN